MRELCPVCEKKASRRFFSGVRVTPVEGVEYCAHRLNEKFGHLDAYPIPDCAYGKGTSGYQRDKSSESELEFYENCNPAARIKIHLLMWWPVTDGAFYFTNFFGIDRHSNRFVCVYHDDDCDGNGALKVDAYTPQEFKDIITRICPKQISSIFADCVEKGPEAYLDVTIPIVLGKYAYYIGVDVGDTVKVALFKELALYYIEVSSEVYQRYCEGKTTMDKILCYDQLKDKAQKSLFAPIIPGGGKKRTIMEMFEQFLQIGDTAESKNANLCCTRRNSKVIEEKSISPENTYQLFEYIENNFTKYIRTL